MFVVQHVFLATGVTRRRGNFFITKTVACFNSTACLLHVTTEMCNSPNSWLHDPPADPRIGAVWHGLSVSDLVQNPARCGSYAMSSARRNFKQHGEECSDTRAAVGRYANSGRHATGTRIPVDLLAPQLKNALPHLPLLPTSSAHTLVRIQDARVTLRARGRWELISLLRKAARRRSCRAVVRPERARLYF